MRFYPKIALAGYSMRDGMPDLILSGDGEMIMDLD